VGEWEPILDDLPCRATWKGGGGKTETGKREGGREEGREGGREGAHQLPDCYPVGCAIPTEMIVFLGEGGKEGAREKGREGGKEGRRDEGSVAVRKVNERAAREEEGWERGGKGQSDDTPEAQ